MKALSLFIGATLGIAFCAQAEIPDGYYTLLDGKNQAALKDAAKKSVRNHVAISYGDKTWEAFEKTDVREVNGRRVWWDMYSNNLVEVSSGHSGLNIEHSVANSWWGKTKNDAYKDLFHLNPSDATANNRKSNYPLGVVVDATFDNGVTKVGHPASGDCNGARWVYEPIDEYKGDFARAFFYIFTIYDDIAWMDSDDRNYMYDGSAYPALRPWAVELLLEWSEKDPVSQKERDRNEAIYKIQNNRNPFIDFPELALYIWGDKNHLGFDTGLYNQGNDDNKENEDDIEPPTPSGKGTGVFDDPYDVEYVLTHLEDESEVWVTGYVLGYVAGATYETDAYLGSYNPEHDYSNTNVLLGPNKDCNDAQQCIAVQLAVSGDGREVLGLENNPSVYQKQVKLKGKLTKYFGRRGMRNVTDIVIIGSDNIAPLNEEQYKLAAYNIAGGVCIIGHQGMNVSVYDISGRCMQVCTMTTDRENITLSPGIYVICANGMSRKLIVR